MIAPINIVVQGPDKSKKGYLIALLSRALESSGVDVVVQSAETHNKPKLEKSSEEILEKLHGVKVLITEQQV
jgi:hypothetical protein